MAPNIAQEGEGCWSLFFLPFGAASDLLFSSQDAIPLFLSFSWADFLPFFLRLLHIFLIFVISSSLSVFTVSSLASSDTVLCYFYPGFPFLWLRRFSLRIAPLHVLISLTSWIIIFLFIDSLITDLLILLFGLYLSFDTHFHVISISISFAVCLNASLVALDLTSEKTQDGEGMMFMHCSAWSPGGDALFPLGY